MCYRIHNYYSTDRHESQVPADISRKINGWFIDNLFRICYNKGITEM